MLRYMERAMFPADSKFGIATMRRHHLMEGRDTITRFKFSDVGSNGMNKACNVIALIECFWGHFCTLTHRQYKSSNLGSRLSQNSGTFQSLGFDPDTTTCVTISSGPGFGIAVSIISTLGPLWITASFMAGMGCEE